MQNLLPKDIEEHRPVAALSAARRRFQVIVVCSGYLWHFVLLAGTGRVEQERTGYHAHHAVCRLETSDEP